MRKSIVTVLLSLLFTTASAQSVWNRDHLDLVKSQLETPMYGAAYRTLLDDADSLLDVAPLSVTMKELKSPSGNKHDYVSLARYFHPNPETPDHLPYIEKDGVTNPEIYKWDRGRLGQTANRVATLALAWHFSGDQRYAEKAAKLLRAWFIDKNTHMNPNLEYAQMIPGVNGGKGRSFGVLDAYSFVEMLDGVALLTGSKAWTDKDNRQLKKWMSEFLDWVLNSEQGREESQHANNHSTAYDVLTAAIALYAGREDVARQIISDFPQKRIFRQIEPDGVQPHEMWRTLSYGYSQYNLTHMIDLFLMAQKLGIKIDDSTDSDGRNFYKALDYLASFVGKPVEQWPGKQISGWDDKQQAVVNDLWRVYSFINPERTDYRDIYQKNRVFNPSDRFTLLYYTPDEFDNVFTSAAVSLRYTADRTLSERKKEVNISGHRVSPRSVDSEGHLTLVHPHDWTSGFFPGELWMMYEFTNDPWWRTQADSFSHDIEEAKTHSGTHDLGFMIGDSFGKGWELTGDENYLDVVKTASETLCSRFNSNVGAIRSWDHNAEVWKFPVIIDNMMNLEMLFKISELTGDSKFHDIAVSHADVTLDNHFRDDGSSYHVVDYDPETGDIRMKVTAQGYSDDSFWSRGQGWAIYGYTMCYRFTKDPRYLAHARKVADWFLSLPNMPSDMIPYWDMKAPGTEIKDNPDVARDASAAALIASALYELARYVDNDTAKKYRDTADMMLSNLISDYTMSPTDGEGFILAHSTGHHPGGSEIDVPLVYADYFLLEALLRKRDYIIAR